MKEFNFEKLLWEVEHMLEEMVANYLDVNKHHININFIQTDIIGEHYYEDEDWGFTSKVFYLFEYKYRKDLKTLDYEPSQLMVWEHTESEGEGDYEHIMTIEDFEKLDYWKEEEQS